MLKRFGSTLRPRLSDLKSKFNKASVKTRIHVNQHNIRANAKGADLPVITVKDYKRNRKVNSARVMLGDTEVCRVVYQPDKPLPCGAKVWVETDLNVETD